jgi:putative tryptophan/tyrosine transport system substrate-binding protein
MRRRQFITLLGSAAAVWPLAARAQQPAMPVIGFLHPGSPDAFPERVRGFRQGLKDAGFVEGENVAIEYRWAEDQVDRLPTLAAELVRHRVAVIVTPATGAFAAKAATSTIPIVILSNQDPVKLGLVASLARPGGNLTGISFVSAELSAKRLELLQALVPGAVRLAVLVSTVDVAAETALQDIEAAARALGMQVQVLKAGASGEIDTAFAAMGRERPDALFVGGGPLFTSRRLQLAHWATRVAIPATFGGRQYAEAGGLMSYGASLIDAYRQVGLYAGRILKGAKPTDLPVMQADKFELVINRQTARMLGLTVPPSLLAIADEVIE